MKRSWKLIACIIMLPVTVAAQTPSETARGPARTRYAPTYNTVEGQPIESRKPNNPNEVPAFPGQTRAPYHRTAGFNVSVLLDNMHVPYSLGFLPDGNILLVLRLPGEMRIVDKAGNLSAPLKGLSALTSARDFGLLDLALDPNFAVNHRIFFTTFDYLPVTPGGPPETDSNTNVASARLDEASGTLTDVKVIFRAQPYLPSTRLGGKTGGRIAIARDGTLFVTFGDRDDDDVPWDVAQKLDNDLGKIIHITPEGAPAPDNPFLNKPGARPEIWAYGLRSPEGLAFDPKTGKLWNTDIGPEGGDEINIIRKGANYGWPVISYGIEYTRPAYPIGDNGIRVGNGYTKNDGMEQPVYYWDPSFTPSGLTFYHGDLFPEWKNSLLSGALSGEALDRLEIRGDKVVAEEALLTDMNTRIRDVAVGPDGAVYVLTDSGTGNPNPNTPWTSKLLKLTPK
ncbi:MAG TPA: PQQ-dependent sugar dehydrogenase [Rhizomicrobium sp.]